MKQIQFNAKITVISSYNIGKGGGKSLTHEDRALLAINALASAN